MSLVTPMLGSIRILFWNRKASTSFSLYGPSGQMAETESLSKPVTALVLSVLDGFTDEVS